MRLIIVFAACAGLLLGATALSLLLFAGRTATVEWPPAAGETSISSTESPSTSVPADSTAAPADLEKPADPQPPPNTIELPAEEPDEKPQPAPTPSTVAIRWATADGREREALRALQAADAALAADPTSEAALRARITALAALRRLGEARSALSELVRGNPDDADLWFELASLCVMQQDWIAAADALQHVLAIKPDSAKARFNLATAYRALGRRSEAITLLTELLESRAADEEARELRAELYFDLEKWPDAGADWLYLLEQAEQTPADGRSEQQTASGADDIPDHRPQLILNAALALEKAGDRAAAIALLRQSLQTRPNHVELLNRLASLLLADWRADGDAPADGLAEVVELLTRSLSLAPGQPDVRGTLDELRER